jgi:hypothetical protein
MKLMATIYRIERADGGSVPRAHYETLEAATDALQGLMGWDEVVLSDSFAVGQAEGSRGSVYGYECYESEEALEAHPCGDGDAPRILSIRGDEAWAMGRESADSDGEWIDSLVRL